MRAAAGSEDTMQEVLLKSVPNLPKFDNPKALMVWLYKVAQNRCLMSRRKSQFAPREDLSLEELMPDRRELQTLSGNHDGTPETALLRRESANRLRETVHRLPAEYRLILVLHDMEELSDSDVAEITGFRLGTVRVRRHRARLFVRKELAKTGSASYAPPKGETLRGRTTAATACKKMFAELSNYLDDELDDSLCEELEKHMYGCEPCKAFLSSPEKSIQQCRITTDESPDPCVAARLRQELIAEYQELMKKQASRQPASGTAPL
jgi:RNA polymerase sigma-70 factor (ECF subfamily)